MTHDDRYTDWDAPYLLGSLSTAERHEYEQHLASCNTCSRAVAEGAALPGLLASLSRDDAFALLDASPPASSAGSLRPLSNPDLVPALVARVVRLRRRRRMVTIAGGLAAAALIVAALVVPPTLGRPTPTSEVSLSPVVPSELTAHVDFTSKPWGTLVDMTCIYGGAPAASGSSGTAAWRYGLYVVDRSGKTIRVASWTADPGQDAQTTGSIDTSLTDLTRVEVRNEASGTILLSSNLDS